MSEVNNKRIITRKMVLPLLPLRGLTVFPHMVLHFDVGREKSIKAVEEAMNNEQMIFLSTQKDIKTDEPKPEDVYEFGTVSKIKQVMKLQNGNIRILVEGVARGRIVKVFDEVTHYIAEIRKYPTNKIVVDDETEAFMRAAKDMLDDYLKYLPKLPNEIVAQVMNINDVEEFIDVVAGNIFVKQEDKMEVLSECDIHKRMIKLIEIMNNESQIMKIEFEIAARVKEEMDRHQKEYYLREQVKAINEELGDKDGLQSDCDEYRSKISKLNVTDEVKEKLLKDVDKLSKMSNMSADGTVMRNYLDTVLELPWGVYTKDRISVKHAKKILDDEHFGLKDVKERITEFLAVKQITKEYNGTILCLVGPPGVGKTSVAKSIAKAMNKNYVRISLGGIRDEAEIRGHRKTYVGAMPGRIVNAIKQAKSMNAFILLDEIDKLCSDYKGDPSSALLEVLDSEQNFSFRDNFLEIPLDLSNVVFVTTANSLDTISRPLLDRMEVINISSYTLQEKIEIAMNHLVPKQRKKHGLDTKNLKILKVGYHGMFDNNEYKQIAYPVYV
ncbi:MAG: LON peptidase substrate-binding domain-containing protein, partial [Clostridia bacterium]|nr:LON peptidase substrate-binding domain-containing protein [Clostridia bacterium]